MQAMLPVTLTIAAMPLVERRRVNAITHSLTVAPQEQTGAAQ
jgi:hypothetical protein